MESVMNYESNTFTNNLKKINIYMYINIFECLNVEDILNLFLIIQNKTDDVYKLIKDVIRDLFVKFQNTLFLVKNDRQICCYNLLNEINQKFPFHACRNCNRHKKNHYTCRDQYGILRIHCINSNGIIIPEKYYSSRKISYKCLNKNCLSSHEPMHLRKKTNENPFSMDDLSFINPYMCTKNLTKKCLNKLGKHEYDDILRIRCNGTKTITLKLDGNLIIFNICIHGISQKN